MLQAHHNGHVYTEVNFNVASEPSVELVSNVYKKVNGWELGSTLEGFTAIELLEIIDSARTPLASKKFDGEGLSDKEEMYLLMMEFLTDKVLNLVDAMPEESLEVKAAMLHAKRLMQKS